VFKVSAFRLDTHAQTGAPLSDCRINNTLVKFTVTSRWERRYMVKAVHMVDNSGSTSRSIISCLGPEFFLQINHILTKFCPMKVKDSGNYDTPCRMQMSEMCCTWLTGNTGPKKAPKIRHLGTIAQLFRAISSQLRRINNQEKTC